MRKYDAEMVLNMDITRRCNMKCDFCLKGDTENQTITKEIVDKTLDEIQNFALASIRLYGGEPFLCPDMIEYVFDQIIERKITLGHVKINTNGTVMNPQILKALERIARYIDDNRSHLRKVFPFLNHEEVDRITSAQMVIEFLTQGENIERIRGYMRSCTNLTEDMIQKCDIGEMINLRDTIIKEAEEREGLREKPSKASAVSQTTPEKLGSALGLMLGLALFAGEKK